MKPSVVFEKVFTRDFSLAMLEVWYRGEAHNPKPWSGEKQPFLPYIIFQRSDGTVRSYYDSRGINWIKNHIKEKVKQDAAFLKHLEQNVKEKLGSIQLIYENGESLSKKDLLKFIENFEIAYPWIEAMWWLCEMDEEELESIDISSVKEVRKSTNKLSSGTDLVVRKSLSEIFPKLRKYIHVLTVKEIESEEFPPTEELEKRDKGFFYTKNKLYVGVKKEDIEKEHGILLEDEEFDKEQTQINGDAASPGKATGKVRRVMGHAQISTVEEGEILVSPMTTPDFVPAMKKAAAIVTDEGGLLCHAAIIARELRKPCIVGTRNATKVLKDGDKVEVDAEKGIVKKLN